MHRYMSENEGMVHFLESTGAWKVLIMNVYIKYVTDVYIYFVTHILHVSTHDLWCSLSCSAHRAHVKYIMT